MAGKLVESALGYARVEFPQASVISGLKSGKGLRLSEAPAKAVTKPRRLGAYIKKIGKGWDEH